jgi:hypothetical protein
MSNGIRFPFKGETKLGPSKGAGVIMVRLTESGEFDYRHRGSLSHIEKVGMLTMALHSMEYQVMAGSNE